MGSLKTILIIALAILSTVLYLSLVSKGDKVENLSQVIGEKEGKITFYKNRFDQEVARRRSAEISFKTAETHYPGFIEGAKREFDIKPKNIRTITVIETEADVKNEVPVREDTAKDEFTVSGSDKWHRLHGTLKNEKFTYDLTVYDSLSFVSHYQPQGVFRPKQLYLDAISHSPYSRVTEIRNIHIGSVRKKPFGIGVFVGYSINGGVTGGFGVTYSPIRL